VCYKFRRDCCACHARWRATLKGCGKVCDTSVEHALHLRESVQPHKLLCNHVLTCDNRWVGSKPS